MRDPLEDPAGRDAARSAGSRVGRSSSRSRSGRAGPRGRRSAAAGGGRGRASGRPCTRGGRSPASLIAIASAHGRKADGRPYGSPHAATPRHRDRHRRHQAARRRGGRANWGFTTGSTASGAGPTARRRSEIVQDAVEEVRAGAPDVEAVGFGIPSLVDFGARQVGVVEPPADRRRALPRPHERAPRPPGLVDNDANVAALAEHRARCGRGAEHAVLLALGTGIGGGMVLDGRLYRGANGFAAELGHMVVELRRRRTAPATARTGAASRCWRRARRSGAPAQTAAAKTPESELGRRLADGHEITGGLVTELAHAATSRPGAVLARDRLPAGRGARRHGQHVQPRGDGHRRRRGGGRRAAARPAREVVAERALPAAPRRACGSCLPHFGDEAGMLGAALLALDALEGGGRRVSLVVCPTPIGNLEDVTLRVLAALREADVVACEDTRRTRDAARPLRRDAPRSSPTTSTTRSARRRAGGADAARGHGGARLRRRACRSCPTRATCWSARAWRRAWRWRCCPGPSAAMAALVASALPADRWRFAGFLPRKQGSCDGCSSEARRHARGLRVAAAGARDAGAAGRARPARQVAVCRELTKVHEEVVRGTRGRAGRALRRRAAEGGGGARCSARPATEPGTRGAARRPAWSSCAAWSRPGRSPGRPPRRGRAHRGERQRALPRRSPGDDSRPVRNSATRTAP